jgi:asparagine synthase (glutamine-hydrolysing)
MTRPLARRGPDGEGIFLRTFPGTGNTPGITAGLGHRRLAIIDLETGDQPIVSEDESVTLVANAEIYNFQELKSDLEESGHAFRTKTDVEVIVHLYEEYGPEFVNKLNGMFAFAIWDARKRRLVLARDRFGIKPLYIFRFKGGLAFASEVKSLLEFPLLKPRLDFESLDRYLALEYVPAPHSILAGVEKLPPARTLILENGDYMLERYWSLERGDVHEISEESAIRELRDRLQKSVMQRMIADVPVGVFLSGGIDSSLVTSFAAVSSGGPVDTFSVAFHDASFDESQHARRVAGGIGSRHHERDCTPSAMREILPDLYSFLDEPFADASVIPAMLLSEFTREHVKVVLGGDGGDELFAGYPTYQAHRIAAIAAKLPAVIRERLLPSIVERLPASFSNISLDFKAKRFVRGLPHSPVARNVAWLGAFGAEDRKRLYSERAGNLLAGSDPIPELEKLANECPVDNDIARMLYLDLRTYLGEDILVKVDRASMAHGLEVRVPFLDHEFVEFAWNLPMEFRLSGLTTKYILKEAARGMLPDSIIERPKKGFGVPIAKWLLHEMRPLMEKFLSPSRIADEGIFRPSVVRRLVSDHLARRRDCRKELWTLINFEMWLEEYAPEISFE